MKVIAIIQARLNSQRLPNKVLLQIPPNSGVSMLEMVVRKAVLATKIDDVIVVTPDVFIMRMCNRWGVLACLPEWQGRNVLREFYEAARYENLHYEDRGIIVRLTADTPLLQPEIIDQCIEKFLESDVDLVYNTDETTGQLDGEGSDVEVFSFEALKKAYQNAEKPEEREHVTLWMRRNCKKLFVPCRELGVLSVNTHEDYVKVCKIVQKT